VKRNFGVAKTETHDLTETPRLSKALSFRDALTLDYFSQVSIFGIFLGNMRMVHIYEMEDFLFGMLFQKVEILYPEVLKKSSKRYSFFYSIDKDSYYLLM